MKILLLLLALSSFVRAEDWTVGGKDYHNVTVTQVDADKVHITYDAGIGSIALADLPPDLQKRFNYVSDVAKAAADAEETARAKAIADLKERPPLPLETSQEPMAIIQAKPQVDTSSIQNRIAELQAELVFLHKDVIKETGTRGYEHAKILSDEAELANLQSRLASAR